MLKEAMVPTTLAQFMVVLETADDLHREWVLDRFTTKLRQNFNRAHEFPVEVLDSQAQLGTHVDVQERFRSGKFRLFVM
jgi:hypothetical protein